ncbi:MAG: hypothetical protein HY689_02885 [Chloroflexi bacterium]|nr:hypothetical protein [Chloroflexota bacterium]
MFRFIAIVLASLALLACNAASAAPSGASPTPITSAGDPTAPVPFQWTVHESHRPDGHRLRLQGGTLHAIPSEVRLRNSGGQTSASAPAKLLTQADTGLCRGQPQGMVGADLPLPPADLAAFRSDWPSGYQVEVQVGGVWRPAQLTFAGCRSIE